MAALPLALSARPDTYMAPEVLHKEYRESADMWSMVHARPVPPHPARPPARPTPTARPPSHLLALAHFRQGVILFVMLYGYAPFWADPKRFGALMRCLRSHSRAHAAPPRAAPLSPPLCAGSRVNVEVQRLIQEGFRAETLPGFKNHFPETIVISDAARSLIASLLVKDPAKRPTAREVLDHRWLRGEAP